MPDGLRRHLTGGYNAQQCMVMEQLQAYMEEHWHSQFHLQEEAEYRAEQERIVKRRKAEVLYQVSADGEPQLLDEGIFSDPRSPAQLDWAENRLRTLGFERQQDGNVVSFISEDPDRIVYADPRRTGSIEFRVYKKPLPKRRTTRVRQQASFNVPDTWRNDLPGKYAARLHTAVRGWN